MKIVIFLSFILSILSKAYDTCLSKANKIDCHTCCAYEIEFIDKTKCWDECNKKTWKKSKRIRR